MTKIGERVGAVAYSDDEHIYLLGYGVYEGDFEPPDDLVCMGQTQGALKAEERAYCEEKGYPYFPDTNPRIKLDNGDTVWGFECWWGPEASVQRQLAKHADKVVLLPIAEYRAQNPPAAAAETSQ